MKKFKEYLLEDKPTTSPSEEAKRRMAFERDVMGMPQQINAKKDMQDLSRHADQVAYKYATGILKGTFDKAAKSANERLHANPTYKYSSTEKIQKDEK